MPRSVLTEDQIPFLTSLLETSRSEGVRAAGLLLVSNLLGPDTEEEVLYKFSLLVRDSLDTVNTSAVRTAAGEALLQNSDLLLSDRSERAGLVLWSLVIRLTSDDEAELREKISAIYQRLTQSPSLISPTAASGRMIDLMMDTIGLRSPVSCISTALGAVLGPLVDREEIQEMSPEVDKAFDKNEMNCYEEIVGLALLVLPKVSSLVKKLSPKLQEMTFKAEKEVMKELLPELWGSVRVYSLTQLVEYLVTRLTSISQETDLLQSVVITLILTSLRCSVSEGLIQGNLESLLTQIKNKSYFVKSLELSLLSSDLRQG